MSFGSSMRFEVKDGGKGGIFWQKEKPKEKSRKFGYKNKELRHSIRRPEAEYIEEPKEKPKPSKDFIRRNRDQYKQSRPDDDKENYRSSSVGSGRASSSIKPGTVTLTQGQLNALLTSVGKLKPGEASNIRISIDADNNTLQLDTPRENLESAPNSNHSDAGHKEEEISIFGLTKSNNAHDQRNRGSSGYGSEDKSGGGSKGVRFDTARNQERMKTPETTPAPPPVPWRHMTVAERKRLQWAREREAEEELQKQRKTHDPWGHPGAGAPKNPVEPEPKRQPDNGFKSEEKEEEKLRKAIDAIEAKYGDLLKDPPPEKSSTSKPTNDRQERNRKEDEGGRGSALEIPGLDSSYAIDKTSKDDGGKSKSSKHVQDKGNTRPPRRPDRRDPRKEKEEARKEARKTGGPRQEEGRRGRGRREEEEQGDRVRKEEGGGGDPRAASSDAAPAAMQTSLFIGQSEPDTTQFLSKKELEKKRWLEELDRQREEKRLQKQREKEKEREGVDDTWADRFAAPSSRPPLPPQSYPQQQQQQQQQQYQQQQQPSSYTSTSAWERFGSQSQNNNAESDALPPAAMRSAMTIGNIAPNTDKIALRQAEEKRLWLEELNKQREEQREARMQLKDNQRASEETWANRFTQDPRTMAAADTSTTISNAQHAPALYEPSGVSHYYNDTSSARVSSAPQPAVTESLDLEDTTFLRGQNVHMDPVTRKELEEKRRKHLEYQAAIKAQMDEKEKLKREERESKWKEEIEGEKRLQAERDTLQRQLEAEHSRSKQKEDARQRQVEQVKSMMDAEQERAQGDRMMKRLSTLQKAGHDVTSLRAHYEGQAPLQLYRFV